MDTLPPYPITQRVKMLQMVPYPAERTLEIIKKPTPTKTLIVVILDESGSMNVQKNNVLGGYKHFIDEQKEIKEDEARLALITFSDIVKIQHTAMSLSKTPELTSQNYRPGGGTALYDAVAAGIQIAESTRHMDERVLVLIMTDGRQNDDESKKRTELDVHIYRTKPRSLGQVHGPTK